MKHRQKFTVKPSSEIREDCFDLFQWWLSQFAGKEVAILKNEKLPRGFLEVEEVGTGLSYYIKSDWLKEEWVRAKEAK